ncbi:MAG TPA: diguanylate cyclase [Gemmatimonas sp.]|uniref:diguanylate cyclase n=1 Tax=Gemmatimonas sp. TaxID=1962908 RepID=UPI002ED9D6E7
MTDSSRTSLPHGTFHELVAQAQREEKAGHRLAARKAYESALMQFTRPEDARESSDVLRWIARTYIADGDGNAALECLDAALAVAEAWNDHAAAGHAFNVQAVVHWQTGDLDEAERLYLLARQRALHAGDAKLAAMTAQNLGVLANIRGDFALAERQYRVSLEDYRSLGLLTDVCVALNNLGLLYIAQKRWEGAEEALLEGVRVCEPLNDVNVRLQLDINLAELWVAQGEFARAHGAVTAAQAAAVQLGDGSAIAKSTKLLGVIASNTGKYTEAEQHLLQAEEVATARGEKLLLAEIARDRAALARRTGRNRDVLQQLNRAHRLFSHLRAQSELRDIGARVDQLEQEFVHVARRWGESIEAKDRYTQGHCQRVAELACAIAEVSGMDQTSLFWFRIGALLHDVGKLVIPEEVLNKPGKLDDAEWALMKGHTTAGAEMLNEIEFPWDVRPMVESHHERWDGRGYPHGLAGNDIPLVARILTIADVYDALTSVRSYKRALTHEETMAILRKDVGTVFDPTVFAWFEQIEAEWARRSYASVEAPLDERQEGQPAAVETSGLALDELTGVALRRAFRQTASRTLEARHTTGRPVALIILDVDRLSVVNEQFGTTAGDQVLQHVSQAIRTNVRPSDFVGRYAGDEFVVLLSGVRFEEATRVAERIRATVAASPIVLLPSIANGGQPVPISVTVSLGVACAPQHGITLDALFGAADNALYSAKRAGRNQVVPASRLQGGRQQLVLQTVVGREQERARLREHFADASRGQPSVVLVTGEAGVGKSTLLKQLGPDLGVRGGAFLIGHCLETDMATPYGPWSDILLAMHRNGLLPQRDWPYLAHLVPELGTPTPATEGRAFARALHEELEECLRLAATQRPLVLMFDDLQWADPRSWDALEYLVARLNDHRVLLGLTLRPESALPEAERRVRRLTRSERCTTLRLRRLSEADLAHWLQDALGGQTPPPQLLTAIMTRSEGNALFAVQLLRAMTDDGRLQWTSDGWLYRDDSTSALPAAIGDLLAQRVESLSRPHREILALAAVLGREFDPSVLVAACEAPESTVHEALDEGISSSVLITTDHLQHTLAFAHGLLTELLLAEVNPLKRQQLHARVAQAVATREAADSGTLARHYDRAGMSSHAFSAAIVAGDQAHRVFAYEMAIEWYRVAQRHANDATDKADVEFRLATVAEAAGQLAQAEVHCDRALGEHAHATAAAGRSLTTGRMRERLRLQRGVDHATVLEACTALHVEALASGDHAEEVALRIMMSSVLQQSGTIAEADRMAREAVTAAERLDEPAVLAEALLRLGSVLLTESPAAAIPHYRRSLDLSLSAGDRHGQLRCHINIGTACDRAGNHPAAEVSFLTACELARELRATDLGGVAALNLGVLLMKTGRTESARHRFSDALRDFESIKHDRYRLAALYNLAHLSRLENDAAAALELYDTCALLAANIGHHDVEVGALAGAGLAELDLNSMPAAEQLAERVEAMLNNRFAWFQGRELVEALQLRLESRRVPAAMTRSRLLSTLSRVESQDAYAALWLAAECAYVFQANTAEVAAARARLLVQARAHGYTPLVQRLQGDRLSRVSGSMRVVAHAS